MHWVQPSPDREEANSPQCVTRAGDNRVAARNLEALVVDDDPITLKIVAAMMGKIGFAVRTAVDGAQALLNFSLEPCDFVLSDLQMPAVSGHQLGRKIKSRYPGTRVVIMTGSSRMAMTELMSDGCIDGWLFKPFGPQELEIMINRIGLPAGG
jgi:DNA-binding NtrC family response regulator